MSMKVLSTVDVYLGNELVLKGVTLNHDEFTLDAEEAQDVTCTAFLPYQEQYLSGNQIILGFDDGVFAKAVILLSERLCDEMQCDMRIIDAATSLEQLIN